MGIVQFYARDKNVEVLQHPVAVWSMYISLWDLEL